MKLSHPIIAVALLTATSNTFAAVFKCVDAEGKQSYQQQPCPKTSAESRVNASGGDWLRIQSGASMPNGETTVDTDLDMAHLKRQGEFTFATFRQFYRMQIEGYTAEPTVIYVKYNCAEGRIAGPESKPERLENDWLDPYEVYRKKNSGFYPFANAEVVAKVCTQ